MKRVVHAACPHDCPDACGVLITIEGDRATKIQGDPAHPIARGFLCAKVAKYLDRVYSPDRVLYPMRRVAAKGIGGFDAFQRISWDEALDEIATRFQQISAEFGSEAILPYSYGGTLAVLNGSTMDHRFFHRLGASQLARTICAEAGTEALLSVLGKKLGTEPEQFHHSRYIIAWGANIHGNNVHLWPFITDARRNGAKLVVIDPYRTRTARSADWHIQINPGTDVALALGMMHVIINDGLHDSDYVAKHTLGFDALRERVQEYPPEQVAQWTGISADDIRRLAREYVTTHPAVIRLNYGVQRAQNGGMAVRAVTMLPCITGAWKHVGGGFLLSTSGAFPLNKVALQRGDLMRKSLGRSARTLNMSELGRVLNEVSDPPVKSLFVYNSNPAAVCPDHNAVVRGFKREDLFTVVHEQFLTDTTDYADIVLPATTFFEHKDLQASYGHYFLQISDQAIAPVGEARSNVEVFRALARHLGFTEECFSETTDDMIDAALASGHSWLEGIDRARLERDHFVRLNFSGAVHGKAALAAKIGGTPVAVKPKLTPTTPSGYFLPFADGDFGTPSGKAELYSASLAAQGLDPIARFEPPAESRHSSSAQRYPLELLARKADNHLNSTFCNLPAHQELEAATRDLLEINPADATSRGISDGDRVTVFNDRGSISLKALITDAVARGVVGARLSWAKLSSEGWNVNVLTGQRLTDMGAGPTFYSVLVDVKRGKPDAANGV